MRLCCLATLREFRQQGKRGECNGCVAKVERIAPDVGEDAMADCIEDTFADGLYTSRYRRLVPLQKLFDDRAIDIRRKGGRHELVSLGRESRGVDVNTIPDESAGVEIPH